MFQENIATFCALSWLPAFFYVLKVFFTVRVFLQGVSGFEELRKHIKQGNELTKEISAIFQEGLVRLAGINNNMLF